MPTEWFPEQLAEFDRAEELRIAASRPDGTVRSAVPVWVVVVGASVYVRTWHRRDTGWFGDAVRSRRARVGVADLDAAVSVDDVGMYDPVLRAELDAAYRSKYGRYGDATIGRMVTDDAAAATLRLDRDTGQTSTP